MPAPLSTSRSAGPAVVVTSMKIGSRSKPKGVSLPVPLIELSPTA